MGRITIQVGALLALPWGGLIGCGSSASECPTDAYPPAPSGVTGIVHVSAECPDDGADGSAQHPYPEIQRGIDRAPEGGAVLVAPGSYEETLRISKQVAVIGAPQDSGPEAAVVLLKAPDAKAVRVDGQAKNVRLQGIWIVAPIAVGVDVREGAEVTLDSMRIEGARTDSGGNFGYGSDVGDNGLMIWCRSEVTGSAAAGVVINGGRSNIENSTFSDNQGGGIVVYEATGEVNIHDNVIAGNAQSGITILSSRVRIENNQIEDTRATGAAEFGDGILVAVASREGDGQPAGEAVGVIEGNTIRGSARVGVLFSGGVVGELRDNHIEGNAKDTSFGAGVWLQGGAGASTAIEIATNEIVGNRYVGVGLTSGAQARIAQNTAISGSVNGTSFVGATEVLIGDGIAVFDGASASIQGNAIEENGRFGVIFDGALDTASLSDNRIEGSGSFGLVAQNQAMLPDLGMNTFTRNGDGDTRLVSQGEVPFAVRKEKLGTE